MIWLLIAFQIKHFLADFPLQGKFMLGKFAKNPRTWVPALVAHSSIHALFTGCIVAFYTLSPRAAIGMAFLDLVIHFTVDRIKASPNLCGRWQMSSPFFWWALGADQMVHHLTHYFIIWSIV